MTPVLKCDNCGKLHLDTPDFKICDCGRVAMRMEWATQVEVEDCKQAFLTSIQGLELCVAELERDFNNHFPREGIDDSLWNSRSYPGGAMLSIHQDIQRLRQRVGEVFPSRLVLSRTTLKLQAQINE